MKIRNTKPSTFFSRQRNISVRDEKGKSFYFHPNKEGELTFNLPVGEYSTDNIVFRRPVFLPYDLMPLPPHDVSKISEATRVVFGDNKNKATITKSQKKILLDEDIANHEFAALPIFVLGHELFHYVFNEEELCDMGSRNLMYLLGYNPSQVEICVRILFKKNFHRRQSMLNSKQYFHQRR